VRYPHNCRSEACQPTKRRTSRRNGRRRGQGRRDGERDGETFNFSSKNFSCSLRRPEYIARLATRRGEIKIHAAARLFSAACLRGIRRASCRREARAMKDAAVHRRASTSEKQGRTPRGSVGNLPKFANQIRFLARARALSCQLPFLNRPCFRSCTRDDYLAT